MQKTKNPPWKKAQQSKDRKNHGPRKKSGIPNQTLHPRMVEANF